jgi:hypothetical protein
MVLARDHEQLAADLPWTFGGTMDAKDPATERADAVEAIRSYIYWENKSKFSYDCSVNPNGYSDRYYARHTEQARVNMIAALAVLDGDTMAEIIASNRSRDHDGSYYSVTTVIEVRQEWASIQSAPEAEEHVPDIALPRGADLSNLLPVWEVFDALTGRTIGYTRSTAIEPAIGTVLAMAGLPDRDIDALLVAAEALERVPVELPALCGGR